MINNYISQTQSAFIPGRYILDAAVVLHETLHEINKKKLNAVVLKLDFEKAYDKVKWPFLQQALRIKGFSPQWCSWIQKVTTKGFVAVKVNNDIGHFFHTKKGVRQGDPLSPLLFNLAADFLAILINRAKTNGLISRVIPLSLIHI